MAQISNIKLPNNTNYGIRATGIMYGEVDSTSTSTVYTATITGITEYYDGLTVMLKNGIVTSTTNFTININGLGAKYCYNNMATGNDITPTAPTRDTTIFNINYTMLFVYSEDIIDGGAWICYRGYDANTNTIGYQLRMNSGALTVTDTARYYKLYFTSADGNHWVPASVNSTNNATAKRDVNQRPINPFGKIVYTSANTNYTAGSTLAVGTAWSQYALALGYSFNRTGAALTLTSKKPVYVKCAPQSDGSAIMDADTPYVQDLPTADDGKIYIYLGIAYDATHIELCEEHPVYYHKNGAIRLWTNTAESNPPVTSVNTKTGDVVLTASDVGALPSNTTYVSTVNGQSGAVTVTPGLTPLIGSTSTVTPSQVRTAVLEGRDVCISHPYQLPYGDEVVSLTLFFTNFNVATDNTFGGEAIDGVISQTIQYFNGYDLLFTLTGDVTGQSDPAWYVTQRALVVHGANTDDSTTGITISDHSTTSITGVQSSTTSITGVQSTTTTASKVTLGTAFSVPNVTSAGSASTWTFEEKTIPNVTSAGSASTWTFEEKSIPNVTSAGSASTWTFEEKTIPNVTAAGSGSYTQGSFSGGSFTQGTDSFTANTPTVINTSKFSGGSYSHSGFNGGSFTRGSFSGGSLAMAMDTTDTKKLNITFTAATHANDSFTAATYGTDSFTAASLQTGFYTAGTAASFTQGEDEFTPATHGADSHTHTAPTIGTAIKVQSKSGGANGTAPTLGTAIKVQSKSGGGNGSAPTLGTAIKVQSKSGGGNGSAPTLGTAFSIPNVTGATDVTVPIKNESATTVPIKASNSTTVVTSASHTVNDPGHFHEI